MSAKGTFKPVNMRDIEKTMRDIISDYPHRGVCRDRGKSVPVCAMIQAVNASKQWASPAPPFWEDKWWATQRAALNYGSKAATVFAIRDRLLAKRPSVSSFQKWMLDHKLQYVYTVAHNSQQRDYDPSWVRIDDVWMELDEKALRRIRRCLHNKYGHVARIPLDLIFDQRLTHLVVILGLAHTATTGEFL